MPKLSKEDKQEQDAIQNIIQEFKNAAKAVEKIAEAIEKSGRDSVSSYCFSIEMQDEDAREALYDEFYEAKSELFDALQDCGWSTSSMDC